MIFNPLFKEAIYKVFYFIDLHSAIEILFFSGVFYLISLWLKKDKQKRLLFYFYGFCLLLFFSYLLQFSAITSFLFIFTPSIVMIFILLHQITLQQNFVSYKETKIIKKQAYEWLENLMRTCLYAINKSKDLTFIIEKGSVLHEFLEVPFKLNTPLQPNLLETLIEIKTFDPQKFIWLNQSGDIISINASWQNFSLSKPSWENSALFATSKADILILKTTSITRNFKIILEGKVIENLDTNSALQIIKRFLLKTKNSEI